MKTSLLKARELGPCAPGYKKMLVALNKTQADDEPVDMVDVFDNNGFEDALWTLRTVVGHDEVMQDYFDWCFTLIPPTVPASTVETLITQCTTYHDITNTPYIASAKECIMHVVLAVARTIAGANNLPQTEEWNTAYQNAMNIMATQLRSILVSTE